MHELKVNFLSLKINTEYIFKNINFTCQHGSVTLLKGKNGAGKTCLLQCICGVIPKHFEAVVENGNDRDAVELNNVSHSRSTIAEQFGYLMQDPDKQLCFPFMEEELFFGAENLKKDINKFNIDYEMLKEMFPILNKPSYMKNDRGLDLETNALSFGQKKVLLFSGMILKDPIVFLLDEPCAGLSEDYRVKFTELIRILKARDKIIIIVEHNDFFDKIADKILEI